MAGLSIRDTDPMNFVTCLDKAQIFISRGSRISRLRRRSARAHAHAHAHAGPDPGPGPGATDMGSSVLISWILSRWNPTTRLVDKCSRSRLVFAGFESE